jgi:hypothetical protein
MRVIPAFLNWLLAYIYITIVRESTFRYGLASLPIGLGAMPEVIYLAVLCWGIQPVTFRDRNYADTLEIRI